MKKYLITGGCGFIGSCFVINKISKGDFVVNVDKLTYAGSLDNVSQIANHKNYKFIKADICDKEIVSKILKDFEIDFVVNFAAESHVDNSISAPDIFIKTNINGVYSMLTASLDYWLQLELEKKNKFRFLQISTDEVYGSLSLSDAKFNENTNYKPSSPYSASKASGDHLVQAWHETYGLPTIITNCSNNFGPRQHREKLIPTIISACINGAEIPIYGNGKNIRDWIYVEDHCYGVELALEKAKPGSKYCFGGNAEIENLQIANLICEIFDEIKPKKNGSYKSQITFVKDRPGHDFRYAIDDRKAQKDLGFKISKSFNERIRQTVESILKSA